MKYRSLLLPLMLVIPAFASTSPPPIPAPAATSTAINEIADAYIKLTLEAATHEAEYVDAYYGPAALQEAAEGNPPGLYALFAAARALTVKIE